MTDKLVKHLLLIDFIGSCICLYIFAYKYYPLSSYSDHVLRNFAFTTVVGYTSLKYAAFSLFNRNLKAAVTKSGIFFSFVGFIAVGGLLVFFILLILARGFGTFQEIRSEFWLAFYIISIGSVSVPIAALEIIPKDQSYIKALYAPLAGGLVAAWAAGCFIVFDWQSPIKNWPNPVIIGFHVGCIVSSFLVMVFYYITGVYLTVPVNTVVCPNTHQT